MKSIELAVFDMAGTTVNEDNVVYKTIQKVLEEAGYRLPLGLVLKHGAGKEKRLAITEILAVAQVEEVGSVLIDRLYESFRAELKEAYEHLEVSTFNGVENLFSALMDQGIRVVLNTGYDRRTAEGLIEKLGWRIGHEIDGLITADDVKNSRPYPDMIELAMRQFSITEPGKVLKAGDSAIDIEEGKNAGCGLTIGVLTGAQSLEQLREAEPDYVLEGLADLRKLIEI